MMRGRGQGRSRRLRRRALRLVGRVAVAAGLTVFATAVPAFSAQSADQRETDAYLMAQYSWAQQSLANVNASRAEVEMRVTSIGSECPGILQGAPTQFSSPRSTSFARGVGESKREEEQLNELERELRLALGLIHEQSDRQPLTTLAGAIGSLRWSNPELTRLVGAEAAKVREELALAVPDVCADITAWVRSGYKTLSPATKELRAKEERIERNIRVVPGQSVANLLRPYEGTADKALIAKTAKLEKEIEQSLAGLDDVYQRLYATLGVARETPPSFSHPPAGAVVVGKGRTAAGGRYEVWVETKEQSGSQTESGCAPQMPLHVRTVTNSQGGASGCYSRGEVTTPPFVNCDEGRLTIEAQTPAAVRSARLRMSDGRQITSRVAFVPARLGGPTGFYYQVVRGPSPIPVSLAELDAHGKVLRALKLHRFVGCTKHLLKFLKRGIRALVHGRVPQGPTFSIVGEAYRFLGHIHFALDVETSHGGGGESPSGQKPNVFSWSLWTACRTASIRDRLRAAQASRRHRARAHVRQAERASPCCDSQPPARRRCARLRGFNDGAKRTAPPGPQR